MVKLLVFLPGLAVAASTPWIAGQQVQTTSGIVSGFSSSYATDVSEYRGIRFGETTAGSNRFMAPKRFNSNNTFDTKNFVRYILKSQFDAVANFSIRLSRFGDLFISLKTNTRKVVVPLISTFHMCSA
jgi:hypothetical protein